MLLWVWLVGCGATPVTVSGPDVRLSPATLTFGEVPIGSVATASVVVTNVGTHPTAISTGTFSDSTFGVQVDLTGAVDADGAPLALDPSRPVLPPGAKLPMVVTFSPVAWGAVAADLSIRPSGDDAETFADPRRDVVRLLAVGSTPPEPVARPWPRFARQIDAGRTFAETSIPVAFTNAGDAPYTLLSAAIPGCGRAFALDGSALPAVVAPGGEGSVAVVYTPSDGQPAACDVVLTTDAPGYEDVRVTVAVDETCQGDEAPAVTLVDPTASISIPRDHDAWLTVAVDDGEWPVTALACAVESAALGETIADCGLVDTAPVVIAVPVATLYQRPVTDVWTVRVSDGCNERAVSVPVIVDGTWPLDDEDGDGFGAAEPADCDDRESDAYPGSAERADAIDNDCDGDVDEATEASDDDGDGYAETAGDCDDHDPGASPGADEVGDGHDDDCDGAVDEGTNWGDDDGDGLAERDGDCDDTDPQRRPGVGEARENEVDDDCDGGVDEPGDDRFHALSPVMTAIALSADRVVAGASLTATVATAGAVTVSWAATGGTLEPGDGEVVQWTAPASPGLWRLTATEIGAQGAAQVATATVEVVAAAPEVEVPGSRGGCATPGGAEWAALAGLGVRRRGGPRRRGGVIPRRP